eukprot:Sspe_Gene.103877::Locus_79734_Transcript_1_1_Confidence_1.000_Length_673::g.103877::m.103877
MSETSAWGPSASGEQSPLRVRVSDPRTTHHVRPLGVEQPRRVAAMEEEGSSAASLSAPPEKTAHTSPVTTQQLHTIPVVPRKQPSLPREPPPRRDEGIQVDAMYCSPVPPPHPTDVLEEKEVLLQLAAFYEKRAEDQSVVASEALSALQRERAARAAAEEEALGIAQVARALGQQVEMNEIRRRKHQHPPRRKVARRAPRPQPPK